MSNGKPTYAIKYILQKNAHSTGTLEFGPDALLVQSPGSTPSSISIPYNIIIKYRPSKDLATTDVAKLYYIRLECTGPFYEQTSRFDFQCLNPPDYDPTTPGAFESSPAAIAKKEIGQRIRQIIKQQTAPVKPIGGDQPATSQQASTTTPTPTTGTTQQQQQQQQPQDHSTMAPKLDKPTAIPSAPGSIRANVVPRVSSADRFDRKRALEENPQLRETFDDLVVNGKVITEEDFWLHYRSVVDLIRAKNDQPVIPSSKDVIGVIPGLATHTSSLQTHHEASSQLIINATRRYLASKPRVDPRTADIGQSLLVDGSSWAPQELHSERRSENAIADARTAEERSRFKQYDDVIKGLNAIGVMTSNQISTKRGDVLSGEGYQHVVENRLQSGSMLGYMLDGHVNESQSGKKPIHPSSTTHAKGSDKPKGVDVKYNEMIIEPVIGDDTLRSSSSSSSSHTQTQTPTAPPSTATPTTMTTTSSQSTVDRSDTSSSLSHTIASPTSEQNTISSLFTTRANDPYAVMALTTLNTESLTTHGSTTNKRRHTAPAYALILPKTHSTQFNHVRFPLLPNEVKQKILAHSTPTPPSSTPSSSSLTTIPSIVNHIDGINTRQKMQLSLFTQHSIITTPFKRPRLNISKTAVVPLQSSSSSSSSSSNDGNQMVTLFPNLLETTHPFSSSDPTSDTSLSSYSTNNNNNNNILIPLHDVLPVEVSLVASMTEPSIASCVLTSTIPPTRPPQQSTTTTGSTPIPSSSSSSPPKIVEKFLGVTTKLCSFYWQAANTPKTVKIMERIRLLKKEIEAMKITLTTKNAIDQVLLLSTCDRMIEAVSYHFEPH